jgi:hypothetical protein
MLSNRDWALWMVSHGMRRRTMHLLKSWVIENPDDWYAHMELIWCFWKDIPDRPFGHPWKDCYEFYNNYQGHNQNAIRTFLEAEQLYYDDHEARSIPLYQLLIDEGIQEPCVFGSLASALKAVERYQEAYVAHRQALKHNPLYLPSARSAVQYAYAHRRYDHVLEISQPFKDVDFEALQWSYTNAEDQLSNVLTIAKFAQRYRDNQARLNRQAHPDTLAIAQELFDLACQRQAGFLPIWAAVRAFNKLDRIWHARILFKARMDRDTHAYKFATALCDYYAEDHYETALEKLNELAKENLTDQPLVLLFRALVHKELKDSESAYADLNKCRQIDPLIVRATYELIRDALDRGDYETVAMLSDLDESTWDYAMDFMPNAFYNLAFIASRRVKALHKLEKLQEAFTFAAEAMTHLPRPSAELLFQVALLHIEEEPKKAVGYLEQAFNVEDDAASRVDEQEIEKLEQLKVVCPTEFIVRYAIALAHAYNEDLPGALERMTVLCKDFPHDVRCQYHRANMIMFVEDDTAAIPEFWRAVNLDKNHEEAHKRLIGCLVRTHDLEGLFALKKKVPERPDALLAALYVADQDKNEELRRETAARLAAEHSGNLEVAERLLGITEGEKQHPHVETILKHNPFDHNLHNALATAYLEEGAYENGITHDLVLLRDTGRLVHAWRIAVASLLKEQLLELE